MSEKECCGTCKCWRKDQWESRDRGMIEDSVCRLNPTPIPKRESDWCGQHQSKSK